MNLQLNVPPFVRKLLSFGGLLLLTACAGAQFEKNNAALREKTARLILQEKANSAALDAAKAARADLEAKLADAEGKLAIADARVGSLTKSNKDLSDSLGASQNELSRKLNETIAEKDGLAQKLAEAQKEALASARAKNAYRSAREKAAADLAKATQERDVLAAQWKTVELSRQDGEVKRAAAAARRHEEMGSTVDALLTEMQAGNASAAQAENSFAVTLSDGLLFDDGAAKIRADGAALLERVGRALKALGDREISVAVHTDNAPIKKGLLGGFDDHWSLSAARAAAAARWLHEHSGLDPARLSAQGFGEFRPLKPNDSEESRAANRRVVIEVKDPLTK